MRKIVLSVLLICGLGTGLTSVARAGEPAAEPVATRYGVSLLTGLAYDPDHFGLTLLQGVALFDYDRIFWHPAPADLRLKLELNLGLKTDPQPRGVVSANALALYYLGREQSIWRPYVEAGIGIIYTDFQVEDQGLRINFNPQCGVGVEHPLADGGTMTLGLRLSHISNGHLHHDNRGINAALVAIGYLF